MRTTASPAAKLNPPPIVLVDVCVSDGSRVHVNVRAYALLEGDWAADALVERLESEAREERVVLGWEVIFVNLRPLYQAPYHRTGGDGRPGAAALGPTFAHALSFV